MASKNAPLFNGWQGKPLEEVLGMSRELVEDINYPTVRAWRENGGGVVGHFQVYFPEEIAHAQGMLPVKIRGGRTDGVNTSQHFGSYLCSIIKTSLDLSLENNIQLDMFVTHPICDGARNLAGVWGRNASYKSQVLQLPQNANSEFAPEFLRHEYDRLSQDIEDAGGTKLTEDALRNSVEVYNLSRRLMRQLYDIRRETPWKIGAEESLILISLAGFLPREEFNDLLEAVLPLIKERKVRKQDRMRVVFEGGFCEVPPIDLLASISRSSYVVDDDLFIGMRWIQSDVSTQGDVLQNLATAYLKDSSYSPVQHDNDKPKEEMLVKRYKAADAEAVILAAAKMCEPGLDEQVAYTKELDEMKIPYFVTEFEENQNTFDDITIQMETFVENIMFD